MSDVILVTGFEPYAEHRANPSMDVAKSLDGRRVGGDVVRAAVLPVHHVEAAWRVAALLDEHEPRATFPEDGRGSRADDRPESVADEGHRIVAGIRIEQA